MHHTLWGESFQRSYALFNHLTVVFWTLAYLIIVLYGIQDRKNHRLLFMPLISGMLAIAWEINALLISGGFYGHVLWTALDIFIFIHNVCFLEKSKRGKYLLLTAVSVIVLYGIFRVPNADGQRNSSFVIDIILATEYVLCAKQIARQGKIPVGVLKFLGDLFAWLANMQSSVFVAVSGLIVALLHLFYLAICLEQDSRSRKGARE